MLRKWFVRVVVLAAWLYPLSLVAVVGALAFASERVWLVAAGAYLPRSGFAFPLLPLVPALLILRRHRELALQAVSLVLLLVPIMGLVVHLPGRSGRGPTTLRLLSFNVDSGERGVDAVVGQVASLDPDIVVMQEVGARGPALREALEARYPVQDQRDEFVLATREKLVTVRDPDRVEYQGRPRQARYVAYQLETRAGPLVVFNVHPISPRESLATLRGDGLEREILSGRLFSSRRNMRSIEENVGLRALQIASVRQGAASSPGPVIFAGDTNSPGLNPVLRREWGAYHDGFLEAGSGFGYTFPVDNHLPWMRIDRIFGNDGVRFVDFGVGETMASDHHCVYADVALLP